MRPLLFKIPALTISSDFFFSRSARQNEGRPKQVWADVQTRPREKTASHAAAASHRRPSRHRRLQQRRLQLEPQSGVDRLHHELAVELAVHAADASHQARNPDSASDLNDVITWVIAG